MANLKDLAERVKQFLTPQPLVSAQPWNNAGNKFQDQQGWFRGGQFTPGKQIGEAVNQQAIKAWSPGGIGSNAVMGARKILGTDQSTAGNYLDTLSNVKRFEFPTINTGYKGLDFAGNLAKAIPESLINIPRNIVVGPARIGNEVNNAIAQKRGISPLKIAQGVAPLAEGMYDAMTLGLTSPVKSAFKQGTKELIKTAVKKSAIKGATIGGFGGLTYGVDKQYGKDFNLGEVLTSVGGGALLGSTIGGTTGAVGAITGLFQKPEKIVIEQLRDLAGRFKAGDTPKRPAGMPLNVWKFQTEFNTKYKRNPYTLVSIKDVKDAFDYEAKQRVGLQVRDINLDKNPLSPQGLTPTNNNGYFRRTLDSGNGETMVRDIPVEKAKPVEINPQLETFITKVTDPKNPNQNGWHVIEKNTGLTLTRPQKTMQAAIDEAKSNIDKVGIEKTLYLVKNQHNQPGQPYKPAPRISELQQTKSQSGLTPEVTKTNLISGKIVGKKPISPVSNVNFQNDLPTGTGQKNPAQISLPQQGLKPSIPGIKQSDSLLKIINPNVKERGFTTSVQEAPNVVKPVKTNVQGTYTPKPNKKLMGEAEALLQSGATIDFKNAQNLDQKVAATIKEAINQQKVGNHEAAANLFNNLSEHGTELGRGVQAFSLLENMSPEAIALSAAGKIKKYNLTATRKIPELSGEQLKLISDKVTAMDLLKGREKNIALNEINNMVNEFIPSSLADKALSVWKAGLLTSLRTHERNFVGNTIHGAVEVAKDVPGSLADIGLSAFTGKRTLTSTLKGLGEFGSKSTGQQMQDIFQKGFDPSEQINKFDHKQITWGKNPLEQGLKKYTDIVFRSLGAADKPFYNSAYARSLYDQAGAEAINAGKRGNAQFIENLVKNPTELMLKNAISDANVATFKNKNVATNTVNALKRGMGDGWGKVAAEVTMPFTGVPSSILGQIGAYSPVGLLKGMATAGKVTLGNLPELQRQAAQEIGRGVIGTGIFGLGAYLATKGIITGQPKDATEAALWEAQNKPRNSILIGGKWRSLNSIGPEAVVFLAGTKLQQELANPEGSMANYGLTLGKDYLDQSFVQGLQGPINALTDPQRYGKSYAGQLISSPIPNIVKDLSRSIDPYARETNTVVDYAKSATPGLRNTLIERRDQLGNIIPQEPTGVGSFLDLFNSKTPIDNAVVNEISRLYDTGNNALPSKLSTSQTISGQKTKLTPVQLNSLEAGVGEALKPQLEALIISPTYQELDDESKTKAIDKLVTSVRTALKNAGGIVPGVEALPPKATTVKISKATTKKAAAPKKITIAKQTAPKKISFKISKFTPKKVTIAKAPSLKQSKVKAYKNIKISKVGRQSKPKNIAFKITKRGSLG